jgi:hypothetical protein
VEQSEPRPVTPVLFSTLEGSLGYYDRYPEVFCRGENTSFGIALAILWFILKRRDQAVYREAAALLKKGACVQEILWDGAYTAGRDGNIGVGYCQYFVGPKYETFTGACCFKFGL